MSTFLGCQRKFRNFLLTLLDFIMKITFCFILGLCISVTVTIKKMFSNQYSAINNLTINFVHEVTCIVPSPKSVACYHVT